MQRSCGQEDQRSYAWHHHNLARLPGLYRLLQPTTIRTPVAAAKVTILGESRVRGVQPRGSTCAHLARMLASSSLLERATRGKLSRRDQGLQASMTTRALRGSSLP